MGINSEAQMYQKYLEIAKLLEVYLNHFPSAQKYALCNRIRNNAQEMFDHMVDAQKLYHKKTAVSNMDRFHERLRMNVMLAFDLKFFEYKDASRSDKSPEELAAHRYLTISGMIDEFGRMIGGWKASIQLKQQEVS